MRRPQRYGWAAPAYDVVSFEWPVYRQGRVVGVEMLGLNDGDTVVDIGCGTGLSIPLLRSAVGGLGHVIGVDASPSMLRQAEGRVRLSGWDNVELRQADATGRLPAEFISCAGDGFDAAIFVYSLSLMSPWQQAWQEAVTSVRPGGRIAVVDMAVPAGRARVLTPLARLACRIGGADIEAHPWTALERDLVDVSAASRCGGHIQVRVGTKRLV